MCSEMIRGVQGEISNAQGQIRGPFLDETCGDVWRESGEESKPMFALIRVSRQKKTRVKTSYSP